LSIKAEVELYKQNRPAGIRKETRLLDEEGLNLSLAMLEECEFFM